MKVQNQNQFINLRKEFPFFSFDDFTIHISDKELNITFYFNISDKFYFQPHIQIPINSHFKKELLSDKKIKNIVFQIGMVELISYWKSTCSPTVVIKPFNLNENQILFWQKLYFNGLGEFFYLNSIHADINSFMKFEFDENSSFTHKEIFDLNDSNIIPVGGGKDSVVTMDLLQKHYSTNLCLIVNPREASLNTAINAGFSSDKIIIVNRTIDPQLLELNAKGFLNGHTPFSALLAFVSIYIAALTGSKNIALSNESSANEATVDGSNVNHQYSKSYEFERNFRTYIFDSVSEDFNYFSFLRPLSEFQIAKLFTEIKNQHLDFKSCNVGSKTNVWCCNCPKCLFTFIMLSAFISIDDLIKIFGENLYEKKELKFYFDQLIGKEDIKPFECVGTIEEVNSALCIAVNKFFPGNNHLPFLLHYYQSTDNFQKFKGVKEEEILKQFNQEHFLNSLFLNVLKKTYK